MSESEEEEEDLITLLKKNTDLFSWVYLDMLDIDTRAVCHYFTIYPSVRVMSQGKCKVSKEKRTTIDKEVHMLTSTSFITRVKYSSWIAIVVLVRKASNKWRMCVEFTKLNAANPKDLYPLPNIDHLIEEFRLQNDEFHESIFRLLSD